MRFSEPDDYVESPILLDHCSNRLPTERGSDRLVHIAGMKIVFRKHFALDPYLEHRGPPGGFIFNLAFAFASPGNLFQNFFYFRTQPLQLVIVGPENLDCDVRTNAFKHFVKAHLNRLRDHHPRPRIELLDLRRNDFCEVLFANPSTVHLSPFLLLFVIEIKGAIAWRHWISCDLCATDP